MWSQMRFLQLMILTLVAVCGPWAHASQVLFLNHPLRVEGDRVLLSGEELVIKYDQSRLMKCTADNRMYQSFLTAYFRFDNDPVERIPLYGSGTITASILVPPGSNVLTMWFYNDTLESPNGPPVCEAYDSDGGRNFVFQIMPRH